jgi:hypothetical protein
MYPDPAKRCSIIVNLGVPAEIRNPSPTGSSQGAELFGGGTNSFIDPGRAAGLHASEARQIRIGGISIGKLTNFKRLSKSE